jgi:hypothetical protein
MGGRIILNCKCEVVSISWHINLEAFTVTEFNKMFSGWTDLSRCGSSPAFLELTVPVFNP